MRRLVKRARSINISKHQGVDSMNSSDPNREHLGDRHASPPSTFKEKNMKLRTLLSITAAVLLSASIAMAQEAPGKIHGRVIDPTGIPKGAGTISLSTDGGHTYKYTFQISPSGDFTGDGIAPGNYSMILRLPDTAEGKFVDMIENVKITAGEDLHQDDDMSRAAYIDKMTPDQKKQVEEFKKKNAEVLKTNQVIKNLNADLSDARAANKDKKYDVAETLMVKDTGLKPDGELLWYELGNAELGLKKWDEATAAYKKAIDLSSASKKPSPELIAGAHAGLGEVYARSNKAEDAASEYDLAVKTNPAKAAFYLSNETVVFQNVGNADAQVAAADKAIAADPKNPLPYYLKGQGLAGKITVDPKTGAYILPPGCADAYKKYLELAPTGQFAAESKAILDASQTKVENKFKAKK
jgi:tetratricopeptide (TPR) repeat protein